MSDNSVLTTYPVYNENSLLNGQSKEAAIISNNLVSVNRTFGRDISNLRANETADNQETQSSSLPTDPNPITGAKIIDVNRPDVIDSSMAELPKTTRDPLLASRELLSFNKLNLEKEKVALKVEIQTKRLQKIPMNLFSMENCDILEINNPQFVSVYAKEIFSHLLTVEEKYSAKYGSLAIVQTEVNERMRAILIDWLVDIHMKFKLLPETLYIAVNLLDRALEKIPIQKQKLQLLGVTAMLIASKYQEIYPPEVKDFVYVADKAYKKEEILEMEGIILNTLQFNLTFPSTLTFLERYTRLAGMDQKSFNFCQYIVELAFLDYKMLKYHSSLITCGAIQLTNKIFKRQGYEDVLVKNTNYTEETMKLCAKDLLIVFKNFEKSSLKAIKRKFLSPQFMEVAKIQIDIL